MLNIYRYNIKLQKELILFVITCSKQQQIVKKFYIIWLYNITLKQLWELYFIHVKCVEN